MTLAKYADFAGPPHPTAPDKTYELTLSGGMMMMGMGSDAWTINGSSYPDTTPIDVRLGQRIRLRLSK
jgi:FtsP/CotA-like multicopper oxidase with cupredoxin domain